MVTENHEETKNNFEPREYQIEMFEKAIKRNTIIFLPTGSGKTFIATMVIKHKSKDIERKYSEGGKRTFFLVNTVTLVQQQGESLSRQLPFKIGRYSGDMGVDYWEREKWSQELENNQIMVMTAQIFLDMLHHSYITFPRVNLLVMDECHHATNKHAMRQIMELFANYSDNERPHVLGLTATLLNGNIRAERIPEEIHKLEITLHSKISRAKNEEMIKSFSTNPEEEIIYYDLFEKDECWMIIKRYITQIIEFINKIHYETEDVPTISPEDGLLPLTVDKRSEIRKVKNMLHEVQVCAEDLGGFGANYALLSRLVTIERLRLSCSEPNLLMMYSMILTEIHKIRKELHLHMRHHEEHLQPLVYCSPKMKKLFEIFQNFPKNNVALVFVKRRITAKVLYYIFEDVNKTVKEFQDLKPDFIVGHNSNIYNDTREPILERRKNTETLKKFNSRETNLLFASDVIEEGLDVQHCNFVIKFDNPNTLCSYIQSKGRARHKDSKYIIFASHDPSKPFNSVYDQYKAAEKRLTDELCYGKDELRFGGTEEEAELYLYRQDLPPFQPMGPGGPSITLGSAVSLLNRYCSQLPHDKFTRLAIVYWKKMVNTKYVVVLQLPINSPLREPVEGIPCENIHVAKASAALEACKLLYSLGELNSNLLPAGNKLDIEDHVLCPLFTEDAPEHDQNGKTGSKKRRRLYERKFPHWLCQCTPKPNQPAYLHLIRIKPNYPVPDTNRQLVFYNLLNSAANFALLTSKKFPKICEFPLFMNVGEVKIQLIENVEIVTFTEFQLKEIFDFHCLLLTEALAMKKKFLVKDCDDGQNSYYIVPVIEKNGGKVNVDWNTIQKHKSIPEPKPVPPEKREDKVFPKNKYHGKIVIPWYRPTGYMLKYVVTKVCEDQNPLSPFPSDNFTSYAHYFSQRYSQQIVCITQPLLEVRAISSKNNCLLPRGKNRHGKRRRRDEDDLEETLVPELCTLLEFPSVYMLKVTLLPSIMHRITLLLLAEELRIRIATEAKLGEPHLSESVIWTPMKIDPTALNNAEDQPVQLRSTIEVSNMLADKMESLNPRDCPWDKDEEPRDIERNIKSVDLLSIIHYDKFAKKRLYSNETIKTPFYHGNHISDWKYFIYTKLVLSMNTNKNKSVFGQMKKFLNDKSASFQNTCVAVPPLSLLKQPKDSIGPEQSDLIQALISISANDVVNYERLETLGDSFLKFMVSLVLYVNFPQKDEGKLTYIKGQIIGNRNLFYCGRNINLGSIIKVNDFVPDDWDIPHYNLLPSLKTLMREANITPGILYQITLSKMERESGVLSDKTCQQIMDLLCNSQDSEESYRTSLGILGLQGVSDKIIADSVEALIGVYLKACGIEGAMKFCKWLQILSESYSNIDQVFHEPPPTALLNPLISVNEILIMPEALEKALGYTFNDRSFLLQAMTHSTYSHNATDCYQRLEFLGDAILDFIITSYIFEKCGNLSPGDLTDLRSALVNNVTFACLTVRHGFHKFVLTKACKLTEVINKFVLHQERRNHKIGAEVLLMVDEEDVRIGEIIDVPKVLGDIFESLAGAVYLDSGKSLDTVWKVFYRLMYKEIEEFSKDVPKNNVRLLYEKFPSPPPTFGKLRAEAGERGVMIPLHVNYNGEIKTFHGVGESKTQAKLAAAKVALRYYHESTHK